MGGHSLRNMRKPGVMSWRMLGRGFWIGIGLSLLLHFWLLASGQIRMPKWNNETVINARIEPVDFKAVKIPEPVAIPPVSSPPPARVAVPPPAPQTAIATPIIPAPPAPPPVPVPEAPAVAKPPTVPPLSDAPVPPPSARPYAALSQAADAIKSLPDHIDIVFELSGMLGGRQVHRWHSDGQNYSLETEGEVTGLAGLFLRGKLVQKSTGRIGALGLMPETYVMQRLSGKKETLNFDYQGNLIESVRTNSKGGSKILEFPLMTGAQDPLSSIYQLAMAARENGEGLIVAAGSKRIKGYPYRVLGKESIDTALGKLSVLHVAREGDSGASTVHLWLSVQHYHLPVRINYTDEDGTEWVLEAVKINT